jgi:putative ABC transport system permease protein
MRPLRRAPWRFAITTLGVAAGVASLVATLASSRAALRSMREGIAEIAGAARLSIEAPGGVDDALLGGLREIARDAVICPVIEEVVLCPELGDSVRLLGLDVIAEEGVRPVELASAVDARADSSAARAADPRADASGEASTGRRARLALLRGEGAFVSEALAARLGVRAGGSIELDVRARLARIDVIGVFRAPAGLSSWERVIVLDVARAQELVGRVGRLDRIDLAPRAGVSLDDVSAAARPLLPPGCELSTPERRGRDAAGMVRALEFNLTAISGISLFVAAVLVATALATSVVQRRATIALLRALGAGDGDIARAILVEAAAIGVAGGALGVALGYAGADVALARMRGTFATVVGAAPASRIELGPRFAAIGLAVGLCVSLCAAILPLVEALRTPPIRAWRSELTGALASRAMRRELAAVIVLCALFVELIQLPAWHGLPVAALAGSLCLMCAWIAASAPALDAIGFVRARWPSLFARAVPLRLALSALAAGRRRAAWATSAVGIAVALSIAIATMVHSFRTTLADWSERALHADLTLRPLSGQVGVPVGRLDPDLVPIVESVFGKDHVAPFHSVRASFRGEPVTLAGSELEVVRNHGGVPFRDGRDPAAVLEEARAGHCALVDEVFANRFGVGEGDRIEIDCQGGRLARTIAGVFYQYGDSLGTLIVDRADYVELQPHDAPREISIFLDPRTPADGARASLRVALADRYRVEVLDNAQLKERVFAIFDRTFAITRALEAVAAIVAVIAVFSVLSALVLERRADIGLLRAVGATEAQVLAMIVVQALLLGVLGAGGGGVCGLSIGVVLVDVVNLQSFGWTLELHQPWRTVLEIGASVLAACVLAALVPAIAAARSSAGEVLREES